MVVAFRVLLVHVIGTTLLGAQIQNASKSGLQGDFHAVGREVPLLSERLETLFDLEVPARWSTGWRALEGLGAAALPTVLRAWSEEPKRERRKLLATAAVVAGGDAAIAAVGPRLRQLVRDGQIEERVCTLFAIGLADDQRLVTEVELLIELASRSRRSAPIEAIAACLALSRVREVPECGPLSARHLDELRRSLRTTADAGVVAAATVALAAATGEEVDVLDPRWLRSTASRRGRGALPHADLVVRGALLARCRPVRPTMGEEVPTFDRALYDAAWNTTELADAVDGTEPDHARCAAAALASEVQSGRAAARAWLSDRRTSPPPALRAALCTTARGRGAALREGWLRAVPDGRGVVDAQRRARLAFAWSLAVAPDRACAAFTEQARDPEIRDAAGLALAWRLFALDIEDAVVALDEGFGGAAGVPSSRWSPWFLAAAGSLELGDGPGSINAVATDDVGIAAAAKDLLAGRLTRSGALRVLEDAAWRLQVHPSRELHELRLDWMAELMLVGSNSGAASLGIVSDRRDAAYQPEGVDETADRFFSILAAAWKHAYLAGSRTPSGFRLDR